MCAEKKWALFGEIPLQVLGKWKAKAEWKQCEAEFFRAQSIFFAFQY